MKYTEALKDLIARCWIRYQSNPNTSVILEKRLPEPDYRKILSTDGDQWPWNEDPESILTGIIYKNPDIAYDITLKIIDSTEDEWLLTLVATGSLESLIKYNNDHKKYRAMYEELAMSSPKHKSVLASVWL